jgi:glycosidase
MFTIPGIPTIYYGDEIGMTGAADPDNRRMMRFGKDLSDAEKNMLQKVRGLTELRNRHIALRRGDFYPVFVEKDVLGYLRNHVKERILVVLNKGQSERQVTVALPKFYRISGAADCLNSEKIEVSESRLTVTVPATGYRVLELY